MAYNKAFGKTVKSAGKPESRRNSKDKSSSPLNFDWSSLMDKGQLALTAAGMLPIVGNAADIANTAISSGRAAYAGYTGDTEGAKKHTAAAALNLAAAVPGAGLAVGAGKLAKAGVAAAKGSKAAQATAKTVGKYATKAAVKTTKKLGEAKSSEMIAESEKKKREKNIAENNKSKQKGSNLA
jgi:thiol:disulfide interchange protein